MQGKEENITKTIHRLSKYITTTGSTFNKLAVELGLSNSYFSKMLKSEGSVGSDIIENILRIHPDINPDWLLTGQGEMLRSDSNSSIPQQTSEPQSPQQSEVITLLKEQLKEKEVELKELYQEVGQLKLKNKELEEKIMGLDLSGLSSSHSRSHSQDVTSVNVRSKK